MKESEARGDQDAVTYLRTEKAQLRTKEAQLRTEKEILLRATLIGASPTRPANLYR